MRIRLKAEASNKKIEEDNLNVIRTRDSPSVTEGTSVDSGMIDLLFHLNQASTLISRDFSSDSQSTSNGPVKGPRKDSSTLKSNSKSTTKDKKEAQNLIGKINNLVTADLGNIVEGRDFLTISTLQFLVWVCSVVA